MFKGGFMKQQRQLLDVVVIMTLSFLLITLFDACNQVDKKVVENFSLPSNTLDYKISPADINDKSGLCFSDQGAWFAYGFPDDSEYFGGFSGPFLMTQDNGVWSSKVLSQLQLYNLNTNKKIEWNRFQISTKSYNSHLEQVFESEFLRVEQKLFFISAHTAFITTQITNLSNDKLKLEAKWKGQILPKSLSFEKNGNAILISSTATKAVGLLQVLNGSISSVTDSDTSYTITLNQINLNQKEKRSLLFSHTFIFPSHNIISEIQNIANLSTEPTTILKQRIEEKEYQLTNLFDKLDKNWDKPIYKDLISKLVLTLQNNWREPAGELKHSGLFPSYHYQWFNGFWAWDSWKHAAALSFYDTELAKNQIRAMYDFMDDDGFIADCIYRDTTIENHNFRNTKPPLSAWAVWKVYEADADGAFLTELFPKLVKQHKWWYLNRDNDQDGLCEYGCTDGTLIAAKWESGMDNAVRFDNSEILKNSKFAWSLSQESVDLNSYLFAEKLFLKKIALALGENDWAEMFNKDAGLLKNKIQNQFFDTKTGWFYDTSLDGESFIKIMGCEGWIPLWANIATKEQAESVKNNMLNSKLFNTFVPFQTLSANHPKFEPEGGYWRGPNWLDQSYFGVKGLQNYGYHNEAIDATYKLLHNADGVLTKGKSIRENYNPITGKGLESENFSWSAAHYLLLLINE